MRNSRILKPGGRIKNYIAHWVLLRLAAISVIFVMAGCSYWKNGDPPPIRPKLIPINLPEVSPSAPNALLSWPPLNQEAAIGIEGLKTLTNGIPETPVPIASITKIMTAYLILMDHPIPPGSQGPTITISPKDVAVYNSDVAQGDSVAAVAAGEQISEYRALELLLVPSADNIANVLANWDAGSEGEFVKKMNAEAQKLGLINTHFSDASGLNPLSQSSASDLVTLGELAMQNPIFASIVSEPHLTDPVSGWLPNYNPILGYDGVNGIKTGYTPQAGGGLVFSAPYVVGGKLVLIVGAVLSHHGPGALISVGRQAINLLNSFKSQLGLVVPYGIDRYLFRVKVGTSFYGASTTSVEPIVAVGSRDFTFSVSTISPRAIEKGTIVGYLSIKQNSQVLESLPIKIS